MYYNWYTYQLQLFIAVVYWSEPLFFQPQLPVCSLGLIIVRSLPYIVDTRIIEVIQQTYNNPGPVELDYWGATKVTRVAAAAWSKHQVPGTVLWPVVGTVPENATSSPLGWDAYLEPAKPTGSLLTLRASSPAAAPWGQGAQTMQGLSAGQKGTVMYPGG